MKAKLKRILASALAVVMVFSLIPFVKTLSGSMSTKASAMETVEGSFDQLANYIKKYGKKIRTNYYEYSNGYQNNKEYGTITIIEYYDGNNDPYLGRLSFKNTIRFNNSDADIFCSMNIKKYATEYEAYINIYIDDANSMEVQDTYLGNEVKINPKKYSGPTEYFSSEKYPYNGNYLTNIPFSAYPCESAFERSLKCWNNLIGKAGVSLGNFGFTIFFTPLSLEQSNLDKPADTDKTSNTNKPIDKDKQSSTYKPTDKGSMSNNNESAKSDKTSVNPTETNESKESTDESSKTGEKSTDSFTYRNSADKDTKTSPNTLKNSGIVICAVVIALSGAAAILVLKKKKDS